MERPIELEQDINLAEPLYKDTLVEMQQTNTESYDNNLSSFTKTDSEEIKDGIIKAKEEAKKKEDESKKNLFNKPVKKETSKEILNEEVKDITKNEIFNQDRRNEIFGLKKKVEYAFVYTSEL